MQLRNGVGNGVLGVHTVLSLVSPSCRFLEIFAMATEPQTHSIKRHRREIEQRKMRCLRRFDFGAEDDYPYRSHGQPFTAYLSLASCIFILIIAKGAPLWMSFRTQPFLSAYLAASISSPPQAQDFEYEWNSGTPVQIFTAATLTSDPLATRFHCTLGRNQNVQGEESLETGRSQRP